MKTTQTTALCGILLHPASHTRSPAMHSAAYKALGVDAAYLAFDVLPQDLAVALAGLRVLGTRQISVSIPHKESILPLLDTVDTTAQAIGAVNTVVLRDGRLEGSNTDWLGAVTTLEERGPIQGQHAVVLGAGGTARALVFGLRERGAEVSLLNRTEAKATALAQDFNLREVGPLARLKDLDHDLLINTTSVGLGSDESPVDASWLRPDTIVLDAVYAPENTQLLKDARNAGAHPVSGKWMLIHQAVAQLKAWTKSELWTPARHDAITKTMAIAFDNAAK